jgi:hypothetical protein
MSITSRLRHNVSFAKISEGDVRGTEKRRCERRFIDQLTASGIALESVEFNGSECCVVVDARKASRLAAVIRDLDIAVTVRDKCACLTLTRAATDLPLPPLARVMQLLDDEAIDVVHLTADLTALKMVVDESEADHVAGLLLGYYDPRTARLSA